jgi:hypothetical protein
MIGLTDYQLDIVAHAARVLPVEKRSVFLERVAAPRRGLSRMTSLARCRAASRVIPSD